MERKHINRISVNPSKPFILQRIGMAPLATKETSSEVQSRAYYTRSLLRLINGRVVKPKSHPCKSPSNALRILLKKKGETSPIKLELFTDDSQKGQLIRKKQCSDSCLLLRAHHFSAGWHPPLQLCDATIS
jgi:hypothetical protein